MSCCPMAAVEKMAVAVCMSRAFSTRYCPLRLRCRELRCAPLPTASPKSRAKALMYVPLLHLILIRASGRCSPELSATFILLSLSVSCPADRGYWAVPSFLPCGQNLSRDASVMVMFAVRISPAAVWSSIFAPAPPSSSFRPSICLL